MSEIQKDNTQSIKKHKQHTSEDPITARYRLPPPTSLRVTQVT